MNKLINKNVGSYEETITKKELKSDKRVIKNPAVGYWFMIDNKDFLFARNKINYKGELL